MVGYKQATHTERKVWRDLGDWEEDGKGEEMIEGKMLKGVGIRDKDFN
jgi:hypothetical protein